MTIKAISLHQPWATAMALGIKTIETRGWATSHRGPLLIHAAKLPSSKTKRQNCLSEWERLMSIPAYAARFAEFGYRDFTSLPLGAFVAQVELTACIGTLPSYEETSARFIKAMAKDEGRWRDEVNWGNFGMRRYGWITDPGQCRRFAAVPARGFQGVWNAPCWEKAGSLSPIGTADAAGLRAAGWGALLQKGLA